MRRVISAIIPIFPNNQQSEVKKTNYWLEKLFNQEKEKKKEKSSQETNTIEPINSHDIVSENKVLLTSEEKGIEQAITNHAVKQEKNRQTVEDMVNNSNRILLKISSVFPFDLFPSSLIAEETRITIIHRQLLSSQVHSVDISDVANIFIDTSILFAQLVIVSNTFAENKIVINRLWKKDAIFMRRIIEGLRMFVSKDIDTTAYKVEDLLNKLKELSTTGVIL